MSLRRSISWNSTEPNGFGSPSPSAWARNRENSTIVCWSHAESRRSLRRGISLSPFPRGWCLRRLSPAIRSSSSHRSARRSWASCWLSCWSKPVFPRPCLLCLPGGPEIGRALAQHPAITTIAFTGSKKVGLGLLKDTAVVVPGQRTVKRVIAEMGGKNAIIIDETADLDEAVAGVIASSTGYSGQKCSACSRAIVHAAVYDLFLKRLQEAVASLRVGNPEHPGTQVGPVIDERAQASILDYIKIGNQEGRVMVEGRVDTAGLVCGADGLCRCRFHGSDRTGRNLRTGPRRPEGRLI